MSLSEICAKNLNIENASITELFRCSKAFKSVVFNSGAGSGKTYALVECLKYIISCNRENLKSHNQKVACITYTNVAAEHIKKQIGASDVVEISTIHERVWGIIKKQKNVLLKLHIEKLSSEIDAINNELLKSDYVKYQELSAQKKEDFFQLMQLHKSKYNKAYNLNAQGFKDAMPSEIKLEYADLIRNASKFRGLVDKLFKRMRYLDCLNKIETGNKNYKVVKYDAMYNRDRLDKMRISHDTLLEYGYQLVERYPRMRQVIFDHYPYILIDEYQDTANIVVNIMNLVDQYAKEIKHDVFIAYFGDSVQNIYDTGVGQELKKLHTELFSVSKLYNRRSYAEIIDVANKVRNDEIVQESIYSDSKGGSIRFYRGNEQDANDFINAFAVKWNVTVKKPLHCLFATNKMVAEYSGFLNLYEAIKNADVYTGIGYKQLNSEFLSHDTIHLGKAVVQLYRLMKLYSEVRVDETSLRDILPKEEYKNLCFADLKALVNLLKSIDGSTLDELLIEIFNCYNLSENKIYKRIIEDIFDVEGDISYDEVLKYLTTALYKSWDEGVEAKTIIGSILGIKVEELLSWYHYINRDEKKKICYHTFHSTKGLEYENVIIILSKDFGIDSGLFDAYFKNYGKNDENISLKYVKGRNILYVAVTRVIKNLRILYVDSTDEIQDKIESVFGKVYTFPSDMDTEC